MNLDLTYADVHLYESRHAVGNEVFGHSHDHFQVLYALDGEGKIFLDGQEHDFSSDQVVLIVPDCVHSIQASSRLTVLVLAFSPSVLKLFLDRELQTSIQQKSLYYNLDTIKASEIRQLLRKMLFELTNYDEFCKYSLFVYLTELLLILNRLKAEKIVVNAHDMRAAQIKEYIHRQYFENITAEDLSGKFGISPRYINGIFKSKYHETPLQYLQKVRIDRSKELLIETEKDIVSISFEVGYETLSTFYRSFRNLVGMSPNKYRNTVLTVNQ